MREFEPTDEQIALIERARWVWGNQRQGAPIWNFMPPLKQEAVALSDESISTELVHHATVSEWRGGGLRIEYKGETIIWLEGRAYHDQP